jgi:2-phosphosulfolactate phosphatase
MKIDVHFELAAPLPDLTGSVVVMIDVLRATSSVVEALVNGAQGVYPAPSTEEAIKLASSLGREDTILCGEARGLKIEGFDLGNSPREFSAEVVAGKRLVMSTTDGTRAFFLVEDSVRVLICSFMNLSAVAAVAAVAADSLVIVCAGMERLFSLDDAVCAGALVQRIRAAADVEVELNDAAMGAVEMALTFRINTRFLASTLTGKRLIEIGLREDLEICAEIDRHSVVPEMNNRVIQLRSPDAGSSGPDA